MCEGTDFASATAGVEFDINAFIIKNLSCPVLLVAKAFQKPLDEITLQIRLTLESLLEKGCHVVGTIINRVSSQTKNDIILNLTETGLLIDQLLYAVPDEPVLAKPSLGEVAQALNADVLCGHDQMYRHARSFIVAAMFGIEPRIAMLSYSTGSSGKGKDVEKVREATALVRKKRPDLLVEGPIQYDAAIEPDVAKTKLPDSLVAGRATVFIFPDLNTGNNTYKAVQRSSGAVAIGPVLQGLNKPVNDLSRGCLVADIVNTVAITAVQAQEMINPSKTCSPAASSSPGPGISPDTPPEA